MEVLTKLKCYVCGKEFFRRKTEAKRSEKLGRRNFCSRSCCGTASIGNITIPFDIRQIAAERIDEFSPFRSYLRAAYRRNKGCDITLEYLKELWDKQEGKCPYTGWDLLIAPTSGYCKMPRLPNRASLDRIDSSKGYLQGNVEFVSLIAQYAKNSFDREQVFEFCQAVVDCQARKAS